MSDDERSVSKSPRARGSPVARDSRSKSKSRSASRNRSRSRSKKDSKSRSRSKSRSPRRRRSRSRDRRRSRSRSRSRSRDRRRSGGYRNGRSGGYGGGRYGGGGGGRYGGGGGRFGGGGRRRSPPGRRRHEGDRDAPTESKVLGIFNLSLGSREETLQDVFGRYGHIEEVTIVYDRKTGRSRGFGFVTFEDIEDAREARDAVTGMEIDGRAVRVDYSVTKRAHTPTPGMYMGRPTR